jgi:hypothetical protein
MNLDALGRLEAAHEELIGALDSDDVDAIEARVEGLRAAVAAVRALGAWRDLPELKSRARRIAQLGDAARIRVNVLADANRQRLHLLGAARGDLGAGTYAPRA